MTNAQAEEFSQLIDEQEKLFFYILRARKALQCKPLKFDEAIKIIPVALSKQAVVTPPRESPWDLQAGPPFEAIAAQKVRLPFPTPADMASMKLSSISRPIFDHFAHQRHLEAVRAHSETHSEEQFPFDNGSPKDGSLRAFDKREGSDRMSMHLSSAGSEKMDNDDDDAFADAFDD